LGWGMGDGIVRKFGLSSFLLRRFLLSSGGLDLARKSLRSSS